MYREWHSKQYADHIDFDSPEWKDLCRRRLLVDDYRCPYCGTPAFLTKRKSLAVHHLDYSKDLLDINNCVSICDKCHGILHGYIQPRRRDLDPRSPEIQLQLREYLAWTRDLIAGKVWREDSLVSGNSGPDAYKQYTDNNHNQPVDG